jgi:hypothetical protein
MILRTLIGIALGIPIGAVAAVWLFIALGRKAGSPL